MGEGGIPPTMRAVVMHEFGPPDVLRVEEVPVPQPGDGEVLVKVHAVSVNRTLDVLVRRDGNNRPVKLPTVLGVDPSGEIVAVGPGVRERCVGDRVATVNLRCGACVFCQAGEEEDCVVTLHLGITRWGGYAEYVTVAEAATAPLPQISEFDEVQNARQSGVELDSGFRYEETNPRTFDVDGILLARPFKIVRIGPVRLFVDGVDRASNFYQEVMGLTHVARINWQAYACEFLRVNNEHHSLALYPLALRDYLGLSQHTTLLSFGVQLANYRQLRDAVQFLRERGVTVRELPPELSPGIDYSCLAIDPEGHAIQLYYYMQQGQPTELSAPGAGRIETWPATVDGRADTFLGETYLGPWG